MQELHYTITPHAGAAHCFSPQNAAFRTPDTHVKGGGGGGFFTTKYCKITSYFEVPKYWSASKYIL